MFPIVVSMLLKAVVGQVDIVVIVRHIIIEGGGPQVPMLEHEDIDIGGHQHPNPDVKFPSIIQERLLDILLGDPKRIGRLLLHQLVEFWQGPENLNAST